MNNTEFFVSPLRPVDFLSIFTSINILSNIFHQKNLLAESDQYKPIEVVNSLCEYLHKTNESENATISLVKKLINNTEFFGSEENELLHFTYADAMFDHFISSVVFSKFGNIFGYLSGIVNATNNLTLPFVKTKIVQDLREEAYLNQDFTISVLSSLSVERITEKLIFPLFPEVVENSQLRIIDTDYIYAQAGLMFARSARINSENTSFEEHITIAQSIEHGVRLGQLNHTALKIFQLPALLYNIYNNPEIFKNRFDLLVNNPEFWTDVFNHLFSDLEVLKQNITSVQKTSPVYHFEQAIFRYKNRTEYAEYLIRRICPLLDEAEYETEVKRYKNNPDDYHCKMDDSLMPDINQLFSEQNEHIANLYSHVEIAMIEEVFPEKLIKFIEQTNVTVFPIEIQRRRCGFRCGPFREKLNSDTILFQTSVNGTNHVLYALSLKNNNVTLHSSENDLFMEKVGLQPRTFFRIPFMADPLKGSHETFRELLTNLVEPRKLAFYNHLQKLGYESTTMESILEVLKNFIPFHNCVQAAKTETTIVAVCTCLIDSLILIPFVGQAANSGIKFFNAAVKPLMKFRTSLKAFTIGQFVDITLKNFAIETGIEFSKLLTRELFQDVGMSIIRTLDPGVEFAYTLGKSGVTAVSKCFKIIGRKMPSFANVIGSMNTVKQSVLRVGSFQGRKLFVGSLTGKDGYGIKYFKLKEEIVFLKRLRGYRNVIPVVLVDANKKEKIYRIVNLDTGELKTKRWTPNAEGILELKTQPLRTRLKTIKVQGLSGRGRIAERARNYIVLLGRREECVEILKTFMSESDASEIVRHYIFEDSRRTFVDFATEWKMRNFLPEWSSRYRIENVQLYEKLRYDNFVEESIVEDIALERIKCLHGEHYVNSVSLINPSILFDYFSRNKLHSCVSFDDLYSFANLMTPRFPNINLYSHEALYMRRAIYRIALRQIDYSGFDSTPLTFFKLESKTPEQLARLMEGNTLEITKFALFNRELPSASDFLAHSVNYDNVNVLFQAEINDPYLIINPNDVLPMGRNEAIFLPENKFLISSIIPTTLSGNDVIIVKLIGADKLSKAKVMAHIMKNLEKLDECEAQFISNN